MKMRLMRLGLSSLASLSHTHTHTHTQIRDCTRKRGSESWLGCHGKTQHTHMQLPCPQPPNLSARTPPLQHTHTFAIHVSFMGDEELGNTIVSFRACQMQRCPAWVLVTFAFSMAPPCITLSFRSCALSPHSLRILHVERSYTSIRTPYAQGSYAQYTLYTLTRSHTINDLSTHRCTRITTHSNTLQHTVQCTLQHTIPSHDGTLHKTSRLIDNYQVRSDVRWFTLQRTATHCNALQRTATHCNALRHNATMQRTATQHTATHCNTLRFTATQGLSTHRPRSSNSSHRHCTRIAAHALYNTLCNTPYNTLSNKRLAQLRLEMQCMVEACTSTSDCA